MKVYNVVLGLFGTLCALPWSARIVHSATARHVDSSPQGHRSAGRYCVEPLPGNKRQRSRR
jgi:hypothetical protein